MTPDETSARIARLRAAIRADMHANRIPAANGLHLLDQLDDTAAELAACQR